MKQVTNTTHPPTPIFTGCENCKNKDNERIPSVNWSQNPCLSCLQNAAFPKTNNFEPIGDGKTYA
jgi:hypothetical protein